MAMPEEQVPVAAPATRTRHISFRLAAMVGATLVLLAAFVAWGADWGRPPTLRSSELHPTFRYVNSGWVSPTEGQGFGPFANELRAYVIIDQDQLDSFESRFVSKVSRGSSTTLGRIDFGTSVLLAAYYLWRPVKGDPLSVRDVEIGGSKASVLLDLDDDAQGREYAYLYAPMVMVAVERSLFPESEPVEFTFELDGHPSITVNATPN